MQVCTENGGVRVDGRRGYTKLNYNIDDDWQEMFTGGVRPSSVRRHSVCRAGNTGERGFANLAFNVFS